MKLLHYAICTIILSLLHTTVSAQRDWHLQSPVKNNMNGVAAYEAKEKLKDMTATPIIVAVIDDGTDITHKALQPYLWVNKGEIPGNNIDDDKNGYIDDVHGWNFLGGRGGDISHEAMEERRQFYTLRKKFASADTSSLDSVAKKEYANYLSGLRAYRNDSLWNGKYAQRVQKKYIKASAKKQKKMETRLQDANNAAYYSTADVDSIRRTVIGDNPDDSTEMHYGNNHVGGGDDPSHGTHTAGLVLSVAKAVNNGHTIRIMAIRAIPVDADERDKDVANSIRYAVDNGARVISMSFGKNASTHTTVVQDAIRYALQKDVLLVHAAGNNARFIDSAYTRNYPNPFVDSSYRFLNWIEVAASTNKNDLVASFSNYGYASADVLAPGKRVYSTMPGDKYKYMSGTSMAAPVVAGVAAVLRSYFPHLTATDIRYIILNSVTRPYTYGNVPGRDKVVANLWYICRSGGIVNAAQAVDMAKTYKGH
jgi:subtilisin family serine protease